MTPDIFTPEFQTRSYWQDIAPAIQIENRELPTEADVVVIGAGYTGLNAALQTSRAGQATLVIDAGDPGSGCSMRNGGQISTSIKPSFAALAHRHGAGIARDIFREGQASLDYMHDLMRDETIDCGLRKVGRFHGIHKKHLVDTAFRDAETVHPVLQIDATPVHRADMPGELGTDKYFGGIVYPHHASLDVSRYLPGLLKRVLESGALVKRQCAALSIERTGTGFRIISAAGAITAGKVILATNGYSGGLSPPHQRRIIPIGSYVIATEEIPQDTMDRIMPKDRVLSDTRKLVYYYRPSPDRKRVLFGGRVSLRETDPRRSAVKLRNELVRLFPDLGDTRLSHGWMGFVGYTFDELAHCGEDKGLYHAMGYCGSGVGMASYLGMKIGRQAAGIEDEPSVFSKIPFQTRPLYSGNPWFLAPSVLVYRARDRLGV